MNLSKKAYFIGVKGVGMTSLACAMQDAGWEVTGSDTDEVFITDDVLAKRSITVQSLETPLPNGLDLIVCSTAYTAPETSIRTLSLAEAVAEFVKDRKVIAVAGVGGKTTTSAMLAALFHAAGRDVGYYVGTSTIAGLNAPGHNGKDPYFIVEADEYAISKSDKRPKFSLLVPQILITTNIIHDHPDIYPDEGVTLEVFRMLVSRINPGGVWLYNPADRLSKALVDSLVNASIQTVPYSTDQDLELSVFGGQNLLDATAAVRAAESAGMPASQARQAIRAYNGAGRRQEFHGEIEGRLLYDDYGHHPGEVVVTVRSFQEQFKNRRLLLVFESHTYSRTEALLNEFAEAIGYTDKAFIMPIFESAREKGKQHSVTPESFASLIPGAVALTWENAAETVAKESKPGDIILTMGAGFVYKLHDKIKQILQ